MRTRTWAALALVAAAGRATRRSPRFDPKGKVIAITGGSRGLGLLLARTLAKRGARLALCARDAAELERARAELTFHGAEVLVHTCDVADAAACERFVESIEARWGRIDALVNNASIIQVGPAASMSLGDFRSAIDVNLYGTLQPTLAALPGMRARGHGRIVNVTSIGGEVAVPHLLPYSVAKFGAVGFSMGLHAEERKNGIVVTTIVPGLMRTGSFLHALVKGQRRKEAAAFSLSSSIPGVTMSAERAAERIVRALERGEAYVTLGLPAKAMRMGAALLPSVALRTMALVDRFALARPGEAGPEALPEEVRFHRPPIARSFLTALGDRAARENNELH